ncbi:SOS response-associated peptidase [Gracilimonas sediminicola]|uniref:SOS response-associated peptidase n=1 Tax=Gracilimonas sediminicola TaxID=2952158 RepID=UPI0038D50EBF
MCGRATLTFETLQDIDSFLNSIDSGELPSLLSGNANIDGYEYANFNAPPTSILPVCYLNEEGKRMLEPMYWWFMKWKTKDGKPNFKYSTFNARADSLLKSNLWKGVISDSTKRCIVPLSGYYEFSGSKGNKTPHYFYPTDQKYFAAAGLYSEISPNEGMKSFTIITTEPNDVQEPIHDRMPAFLRKEEFADWLNPEHSADYVLDMIKPYPNDAMKTHVVSKDVNSTRNRVNEPYLTEKAELF